MSRAGRVFALLWTVLAVQGLSVARAANADSPNVVIVYFDDLGYGDFGCYGANHVRTPHIDRLAREGARLTNFYVAQAVCTASRAALLTGCYPNRIGLLGALGPRAKTGIAASEQTLAEVLKGAGYATAIYGKWHLGHHPEFLPNRHGFDAFYGLPYSNDMRLAGRSDTTYPPLPLIDQTATVVTEPDQRQLTRSYTERAVSFVRQNRERPFLLYVPHSMPHVPLHASAGFEGKTRRGLFADVIAELDASVGAIVNAVDEAGLKERTLIVVTSDNGPWLVYGDHAGSAGKLREGKGTSFDGGIKVPCVVRWPGRIKVGKTVANVMMTIDWLPTIASLCGAKFESTRRIDGRDMSAVLVGGKPAPPDRPYFFYWGGELQGVRLGRWKLHLPHAYQSLDGASGGSGGKPGRYKQLWTEMALYDLDEDPSESVNLLGERPDVVQALLRHAEEARSDLGDTRTGQKGGGVRPPGAVP